MRMPRLALTVGVAVIATACGYSQPSGSPSTTAPPSSTTTSSLPATTTTTGPGFSASLDITIGTDGKPGEYTATLTCDSEATGTGYLEEEAAAACALLQSSEEARTRLIEGPPADQVCTEIYGGSEVAAITGSINGEPVSTTVDRANGCGIDDWTLLRPILVEPYDMQRQTCSAARLEPRDPDPQGDLPEVVSSLRDELLGLASACNYNDLAAIAAQDKTRVSFGDVTDPALFWRDLEANGQTPMADMVSILGFAPGTVETPDGLIYVWPGVFALDDWSQATDAQRQELADVFGQKALADWDAFGGYIGYRVGITEDGHWMYFVAGD